MSKPNFSKLREMGFDFSDTPEEPTRRNQQKRPPPVPVKALGQARHGSRPLPGVKYEDTPRPGEYDPAARRRRQSAPTAPMPVGGPQVTPQQAAAQLRGTDRRQPAGVGQGAVRAPGGVDRRRPRSDTTPFQMRPNTPMASTAGPAPQLKSGEHSWQVSVDGVGVFNVPASDHNQAIDRMSQYLSGQGQNVDRAAIQASRHTSPNEASGAASAGPGPQRPLGEIGLEAFRQMVNNRIQEIVRKKEGGGGYNLYSPNKGKKKNPKPVGEFPTRLAAKRAELARFPPKDPEQLKRARAKLDKLAKDPKKRIDKEKEELRAKKPKRSGKSAGERRSRKEEIVRSMVNAISEKLFREDEIPGSPWDERIASLHPDALSSDKKLHRYLQGIDKASRLALGDGHKALAKVMRGLAKVNPGDIMRDPERGKMYMPITLDVDGDELGPIHLYIDGGNVCIEVSPEARESIGSMDPMFAKELRGSLMSFQEDHLPKIDRARGAWSERDSYLDNLHKKLEKSVGGMSGVELHLARQLMNKRRR